jgi:hypothetical protein
LDAARAFTRGKYGAAASGQQGLLRFPRVISQFVPLPKYPALRVLSRIRRGSSSPVVTATAAGTFVTKLRGAAQGVLPLVAEVIVGELATKLGLAVPERVLVELDEDTPTDDRNDELADLLAQSRGTNLGLRFLEDAADYVPGRSRALDQDVATRILWLDGLVMNLDRTPRNPNILVWNHQPWLIDHGAALNFHYRFGDVTEQSPRELQFDVEGHVFASAASRLSSIDEECSRMLTRGVLASALERVPDTFLAAGFPGDDLGRIREAYVAFLWKRMKAPRPFVAVASAPVP